MTHIINDSNKLEQLQGQWNYPTEIRFGVGKIHELSSICQQKNIQKPLLVTDNGLANLDWLQAIIKDCQQADLGIGLFAEVKPNPTGSNIEAGVIQYHQNQHDAIIAIGGGSGIDAGKAIALMVGQNRPLWDFEDIGDNWAAVNTDKMAPVIAIPTTAGTGSEVGRASVIVDEACKSKKIIFHPKMLPSLVIADPQLTVGLPPSITAATGMDALVHNLEAYCAPGYHPMADGIALEAMRLIKTWLPVAYAHGNNLQARSHMMAASTMGATAFQKGLGAVHALAHPLGAIYDAHHGLLNAILLPYVLQENQIVISEKIANASTVLQFKKNNFNDFFQWILDFRCKLNIPNNLKEIGIDNDRAEEIALLATRDACAASNPTLLSIQQYRAIFERAVQGEIR